MFNLHKQLNQIYILSYFLSDLISIHELITILFALMNPKLFRETLTMRIVGFGDDLKTIPELACS